MYLNRHDILLYSFFILDLIVIIPKLIKMISLKKTFYLLSFTYFFCFLGWEVWWAIGVTDGSTSYTTRYLELSPDKTPTFPNYLHAYVQSVGDITIIAYIFSYGFSIYPNAYLSLNYKFVLYITLIGVAQNIILTLTPFFLPFNSKTDILSWSPIAGNVTCSVDKVICFNNQRMWFIAPIIIYVYLLMISR